MIKDYVAFDLETTGLNAETDYIIEIGALKVKDGKVKERFIEFLKPPISISPIITGITGITDEMVKNARDTEEIIRDFTLFCENEILLGHNIMFDYKFTKKYANEYGYSFERKGIDTLRIARNVHKDLKSKSLETLCAHYNIVNQSAHRAYHDALATAKIYHILAHEFETLEPELFVPQDLIFRPKKIQPCTKKQLEYLDALCRYHDISMPVNVSEFTRSQASKYIDYILSLHGRMQ